ncbi:MAG: cytochrome P450 [Cytophagaceae bacterium]|nr:cytochrome P450 [Cytophagaceae bacterium]
MNVIHPQLDIKEIPAHKGQFLVGNTLQFTRDPLQFLSGLQRQYERIVKTRLVGRDIYVLLHPDDAKHVLQENNRNYRKSESYRVLGLFLGNGLLNSEGDFWRRQRRLAQPAFYKQRLALLAETMVAEGQELVNRWSKTKAGKPVNVSVDIMEVTLSIVTKALFGADVKHQLRGISESLNTIIEFANETLTSFVRIPLRYPTPRNLAFKRSVQRVEGIIYEIIESRRRELSTQPDIDHEDLLDMLLRAHDEETGEGMTDQQLRDEVTTIFMAGHETTAVAMSWALYLLAQNPEIARQLRQEVLDVVGTTELPGYGHVRELKYTMQVVQEVMRLYPPAWVISRRSLGPDSFGEYAVDTNAYVLVCPYLLHRDPARWAFPNAFHPDHFLPERIRERHPYAYIPFGGGPRLCIGNNFALMEMQLLLAILVRQFDFSLATAHQEVHPHASVTLRPKGELLLNVTPV